MTKNTIATLTAAQQLAVYNHYSETPISRFASAEIGRKRLVKLLAGIDAPECKAIATVLGGEPVETTKPVAKAAKKAAKPVKAPVKAKAPAKAAKADKPVVSGETKAPTGAKATILAMIAAPGGVSEKEVCAALGWPRAGGTISRAIKLAPFKVVKVKGDDGRTRYRAA